MQKQEDDDGYDDADDDEDDDDRFDSVIIADLSAITCFIMRLQLGIMSLI